jgi:hypothetical protein
MATTVTFDSILTPRVTVTKDGDLFTAVVEVEGLNPVRDISPEETALGITALDPPTVQARSHRSLIDGCQRAVEASATSTLGDRGGPAAIYRTRLRVAIGVRNALRKLDEDI